MATVGTGISRSLPPEVLASLRQTFAAEVAEQLPELRDGLAGAADLSGARRAAHSIGSSAFVVGEPELAELARDVEARLDSERTWLRQGCDLVDALERWTA